MNVLHSSVVIVGAIAMNNDVEIIMGRLTLLFKRQSRTRYWLMIANDPYDQTYNVFFNSQRANERLQSVPLHKLANYDLADLETLMSTYQNSVGHHHKVKDTQTHFIIS